MSTHEELKAKHEALVTEVKWAINVLDRPYDTHDASGARRAQTASACLKTALRAAMNLEDPTATDTSNQRFYRLIPTGDPTWPYGLRGPDCNRDTPVTRDSPCFALEGVHRACNDYGNKEIATEFYESAHYHHDPAPLVDTTDEDD